jgi:glycosyltransferase involved in cell wall biosynthesis
MIVVSHSNGIVQNINPHPAALMEEKTLVSILFSLALEYPDELLVWCNSAYIESLDQKRIPELFLHDRIMLSYSVNSEYVISDAIGYIEDSPFLKINREVLYPTWLMSSDMGAIKASVLVSFKELSKKGDSDFLLSSIAKTGQRSGLLCYSAPQLLKSPGTLVKVNRQRYGNQLLFKFVFQHYKTRWMLFLLISYFIFEKRIPLISFLRGFFNKKLLTYSPNINKIEFASNGNSSEKKIDVIIPTIGRKPYLYDVLKDLAVQTVLPIRVIIVEQNPELNSASELDYLTKENWPFEIFHHFTHQTGACNARNMAIKDVKSSWVFMADDDIRFSESTLENILKYLEDFRCKAFTMSCLRDGEIETQTNVIQWRTFGSGCSVVASEFVKMTFYNLSYEFGFGEDVDYGMQLRNKGCDVLYNPYVQLKHLKAEVGGFRKKITKAWECEKIQPKPSPTVMLSRLKHATNTQLRGYKLRLFLKFYKRQEIKNPFAYLSKMKKAWNKSTYWAKKLDNT